MTEAEQIQQAIAQAAAVRKSVGWIDRRSRGLIAVRGADRYTWLQGMVSNDTRLLADGRTQRLPACVLDATGHLLSDIVLIDIRSADPFVLIDAPAARVPFLLQHLDRLLIMEDAEIEDISVSLTCLSVQGPGAAEAMAPFIQSAIAVVEADHTGSGGLDWYGRRDSPLGAPPDVIGPLAAEILRVEAGIPLYGIDMDESVIALEAGLGPTHISLTKGCYVGQEVIARIDSRGHTNRELTGLVLRDGPLPTPNAALAAEGESHDAGRLTSVAPVSPAMGGLPIALGRVRHAHRSAGTRLTSGQSVLEVVPLPFYRRF